MQTWRTWLIILLLCVTARGQTPDNPSEEIRSLILQLGDDKWPQREAAQKKLAKIADASTLPALRKAAEGDDPEIAVRAKLLLAELQNFSHVVVDAQGRPITDASVSLFYTDGRKPIELKSNGFGGVMWPEAEAGRNVKELRVSHPRFGTAVGLITWAGQPTSPVEIRMPMVEQGTDAYQRAIRGIVAGADGKPLEGARVTCWIVRTPGQGLIQSHHPINTVLTDAQGRFSMYVPDSNTRNERGRLIPLQSRFQVRVKMAEEEDEFPYAGWFANTDEVTVRLPRAELARKFTYEAVGGGRLGVDDFPNVWLTYTSPDGELVNLPKKYNEGGKLLPGKYAASWQEPRGKKIMYQPIELKADSPEELLFRLPLPVHFRGRAVDGRDGTPLSGIFVMGKTGTMKDNPALLTEDQWIELETLPANPTMDDKRLETLSRIYSFKNIVRTAEDGTFNVEQPIDQKYYDVTAIARGRLPYAIKVYMHAKGEKPEVAIGDMPLFPAARVTLKIMPAPSSRHMSAMPEWILADDNQPKWFDHFKKVMGNRPYGSEAFIPYGQWLKPNNAEMEPILVPADVKLTLKFGVPYEEGLVPTVYEQPIQLAAGKTLDIGEIAFKPAMTVKVRVIDESGKGVEGAAVRRKYEEEKIWSTVHNSDEDGFVQFFVRPNSSGEFGADGARDDAIRTRMTFKVGATPPTEAFVIKLTEQKP